MASKEQDVRLNILNSLLKSTHRKVEDVANAHKEMIAQDPLFYGHLAVWAQEHTDVRDHQEMFVASLLLSEFPEHREAGYVLLQKFPPYRVERIKNHVKKVYKKNPPRIMKSAVKTYLRGFESNPARLDGAAMSRNGKSLTGLYASFRLQPGERAQSILFDDQPPADSKVGQLKMLAETEDPVEQAKLIVENNIPYTTAVGAVKNMTPTVLAALINQMTDQEVLVNLGALRKRGVMENPDLKTLVESKLEKVKKSKKVDVLKAAKAAESAGLDDEMSEQLNDISDTQLKSKGRISMSTALVIDKSSSMESAIEIGKRVGAMVSALVESEFHCWVFDNVATEIQVQSDKLQDWDKALRMVRAGGCTSCGAPLHQMAMRGQEVEQIIMITDQGENRPPYFKQALDTWREKFFGRVPRIVFINVGSYNRRVLEERCRNNEIEYEVFDLVDSTDYYSIPNLVPLLSKPGRLELLDDILSVPLPTREEFDKKKTRLVQ